jgi:methionyl aminopeptidase
VENLNFFPPVKERIKIKQCLMTIESENDINYLKEIGRICAQTLKLMAAAVHPGISTRELDHIGAEFLKTRGAHSAPKITYNFPGVTCISVSPIIAHGIPDDTILKTRDLIHIDVSAELNGYYADTGASMVVSAKRPEVDRLLNATRSALWKALYSAKAGRPLNIIGQSVFREANHKGFNIIRDLTGHGIGRKLHDQPENVPNFFDPHDKRILNEGLVLAIEPFLTTGRGRIVQEHDGWSLRTLDRTIAAQFEHTLIVTKNEPIILTL